MMNSSERIVDILMNLLQGEVIHVDNAMSLYGVSERTIQRDMNMIKKNELFLDEYKLIYDQDQQKFYANKIGDIDSEEILAILKVLIGSRSLSKNELKEVTKHFLGFAATADVSDLKKLITTTSDNYIPAVDKPILPRVKEFAKWIIKRKEIKFTYTSSISTSDPQKERTGVPLNMYFTNHHFYVMVYLEDKDETYIYRLDRFQEVKPTIHSVNVPADKRPDEGKMINKTFLLTSGNFIHYKFRYKSSKQVALDNVPNSHLSDDDDPNDPNVTIVEGDLYSQGAAMWVLGQGPQVEVMQPESLIKDVKKRLQQTMAIYK